MRESPRWARKVMGQIRTVAASRGQTPPEPALMGRKRMPAPTAVPKRLTVYAVSVRFHPGARVAASPISMAAVETSVYSWLPL